MALQPSPLLRGFEQGADGTDPWNTLAPPTQSPQRGVPPDTGLLGTPLAQIEAGPRANYMAEADAAMNLTPEEKYLYQTHLQNLYGTGKVVHPDGSISSLLQMSFEGPGGKTYSIPTVWGGQALRPREAIGMAERTGGLDRFPSYATSDEAEARYQQLHDYLGRDTQEFIARAGRR
jgi:hypothetical protein